MTTYLVRYEIDVDADDEEQAARCAYDYMVQHDSLPPVLEVIPHCPDGQQPCSGSFIDLNEREVVHLHAEVWLLLVHSDLPVPGIWVCVSQEQAEAELIRYVQEQWADRFENRPLPVYEAMAVTAYFDDEAERYEIIARPLLPGDGRRSSSVCLLPPEKRGDESNE